MELKVERRFSNLDVDSLDQRLFLSFCRRNLVRCL